MLNNIIGVKLISGNNERLILNVYFYCKNYSREALYLYREQLAELHSSTSWLDHVVTSDRESISNTVLGYDRRIYNHFPVTFDVDVGDLNYNKQFMYVCMCNDSGDWPK